QFATHLTVRPLLSFLFLFSAPATTQIYTLSLHDALPISVAQVADLLGHAVQVVARIGVLLQFIVEPQLDVQVFGRVHELGRRDEDRKSTRLNSSHVKISYAVFCLKKKTTRKERYRCPTSQ